MAPPPATDQPCTGWVACWPAACWPVACWPAACLPVAFAAGSVSRASAPGLCARTGPAARTGRPTGGSAVSSTWSVEPWPTVLDPPALDPPASSATGAAPPPGAGGQARAAEVTGTCRVAAGEDAGPRVAGRCAVAGWPSRATPPMAPSATRTAAAGTRWTARISPHPASAATACRAGRRAHPRGAAAPRALAPGALVRAGPGGPGSAGSAGRALPRARDPRPGAA